MSLSLWSLLALLSKIALYASVASAIGGVFSSMLLTRHREAAPVIIRYTVYGCVTGIVVTIYSFLVQVGAVGDRGLMGAFDTNMISVIFNTSVGQALLFEVIGFLLIGLCVWRTLRRPTIPHRTASLLISLLGCVFLIASFSQVGHFAEAAWSGKLAISFHILAMSLWMGSLYPLWIVSRTAGIPAIQRSMETFGHLAVVIVGVLVVCGVFMGTLLVKDFHTLISTDYGRGLLLKMVLVGALLLLAASNKWLTVPHLYRDGFGQRLSQAIVLEMALAGLVFVVTGVITVVIGID